MLSRAGTKATGKASRPRSNTNLINPLEIPSILSHVVNGTLKVSSCGLTWVRRTARHCLGSQPNIRRDLNHLVGSYAFILRLAWLIRSPWASEALRMRLDLTFRDDHLKRFGFPFIVR